MISILLIFVLLLIGIPICFSLGLVSLGGIVAGGYPPVSYTHLDVYKRQPWSWAFPGN